MLRSLMFWRLFSTYGFLLLIAIGLLGVLIVGRAEEDYLEQTRETLCIRAVMVREAVRDWPAGQTALLQQRMIALRQETGTRITLLADNGTVLADSDQEPARMENHANRPEILEAREKPFGMATRFSHTLNQSMMYVALRSGTDHGTVATVRVALSLDNIQARLAALHNLVWTAVIATGVAALALAFWLTRRMTQPLQELNAGAERIAAGNYGYKVYAAGRDEVGALAATFNRMSERLAIAFRQIDEDRQQLRMILSGMIEGVIALDAEQRILFANDRAAHLLEFKVQTAVGRRLWEVIRKRSIQELVQRALVEREPSSRELTWNGSAVKSLTVHAAQLPGSPTRGAVLVLHDTSELRRLERLRQEFVANVSHELKTPLSVIKACIETLLDGAVDDLEHRSTFLQQIADQSDRLHMLILDLLSLARIESGTEAFAFEAVPVGPVVAGCLERHRARAEAKNLHLDMVAPTLADGASPVTMWADEESLGQILDNLVDNAVKYTPANGRIIIRWWVEDQLVCLEVEDTGIGIPEADLPRIFERFYRVDKARSRELGGTGLGLSIVKHLVQAMHGSVRAASILGQGTTFLIQIPRPPAS